MQKFLLVFAFTLMASLLNAQAPMFVPSEVMVAGVKLKLNAQAKKDVEETLDLLTRSQYHFQLKVDRTNLYMHFVEEILKREGIPEDFKYLAIQEGEFISDAVSTSNAVGFWQFKKASAQELGVRVDDIVDERKNIIASTVGATKYLKRSNFVFDNWVLSMQSYLQGLTGTQRSVSDKLYGAKTMNITGKSHWYVKKFIAHKLAFQDFVGEGRKNPEVSLAAIEGKGKTLRQISGETGVDLDELKRFNKWLIKSRIPNDKSYQVIYPVKNGERPIAQKGNTGSNNSKSSSSSKSSSTISNKGNEKINSSERVRDYYGIKPLEGNTGYYPEITGNTKSAFEPGQIKMNGIPAIKAKDGDDIQSLSARSGKSVSQIKKYNDIGERGDVRSGNYYYLKRKKRKGRVHYHVVRSGETLWGIAQDYGIRLKQLLRKNRMREVEELKIGRVLWLRFIRPKDIPIEYANVLIEPEKIVAEDQLMNEVYAAEEAEEEVEPVNKKEEEETVKVSTSEIKTELPELKPQEDEELIIHTVKAKETFFGISAKYNVDIDKILEWNGLRLTDGLKIDQELRLIVPKSSSQQEIIHTVIKGDTLWSIARKYDVSVSDILKWNNKIDNALALGEKLIIFAKK